MASSKLDELIPVECEIAISQDMTQVDLSFTCEDPMNGERFIECVSNFLKESKAEIIASFEIEENDITRH